MSGRGFSTFLDERTKSSGVRLDGHPVDAGAHPGSGLTRSLSLSLSRSGLAFIPRTGFAPPFFSLSLSLSPSRYPVRKSRLNYPGRRGEKGGGSGVVFVLKAFVARCANRESGPGRRGGGIGLNAA